MATSIYGSPAVPIKILEDEEESLVELLTQFDVARKGDSPAPKDFRRLVEPYNRSVSERDLIDEVFVFLTGWTFATLLAKVMARRQGVDHQILLDSWRKP